jgi:hypothetical protein
MLRKQHCPVIGARLAGSIPVSVQLNNAVTEYGPTPSVDGLPIGRWDCVERSLRASKKVRVLPWSTKFALRAASGYEEGSIPSKSTRKRSDSGRMLLGKRARTLNPSYCR